MRKNVRPKNSLQFRIVILITILLLAVYITSLLITNREDLRALHSDILSAILNLWTTIAFAWAAIHSLRTSRRKALAWGVLFLAQTSFLMGDIFWAVIELTTNEAPFPSIADGPYLLYYPLFLLGIFLLPSMQGISQKKEWLKRGMDLTIVMLSAALLIWVFLMEPMIQSTVDSSPYIQFVTIAYPVGDLILFYALLLLFYNQPDSYQSKPLVVLAIAIAVMIVADCIYGFQYYLDAYISGNLLDIGWALSYSMAAIAAFMNLRLPEGTEATEAAVNENERYSHRLQIILTYMPYGWVIVSYILLIFFHHMDDAFSFSLMAASVGMIMVLVLIRQIIAINENGSLLIDQRDSLASLHRQADILVSTNEELQGEIRERERVEEQLFHDATHDALTGLANRALFMDRLEQTIIKAKRFPDHHYSVLFLDIDLFKIINDSLGHSAGDHLLILTASRLKDCLRSIDTIARFGGDEFLILLEEVRNHDAVFEVLERIQLEIKQPFWVDSNEVHISGSIGVVIDVLPYENAEDVIRDADIAMYHAKETGKARYQLFSEQLREVASQRMEIENDLRHALKEGEFYLEYQPVVCGDEEQMISAEALIRWRHPVKGIISPAFFIPVAEQSGLIFEIGHWVLEEACRQTKQWQTSFPLRNLPVHVNISGRQFGEAHFIEEILGVIKANNLPPTLLHLEITENVLIGNQRKAQEVISQLREKGIIFLLDDFGKGYSSWNYLANLSIDVIKIDKMFVDQMTESQKRLDIIQAIMLLAHSLDLAVIVEGVETEEQMALLRPLGVSCIQGYYYHRSMPAAGITRLLEEESKTVR